MKLRKDPQCSVCSEHPSQHGLIDYDQLCGIGGTSDPVQMETGEAGMTGDPFEMTVDELKRRLDDGQEITVLDVRTPQEYAIARIDGTILIPLNELQDRLGELDPEDTIVAHCHHGGRSANAVQFLRQMGYKHAINLAGGIDAWSLDVDPKVPRY
ncbi:MAG: rhodanese-like domain-containing protein, partial [Acidobacteriota bacterium]